MAPRPCLDCGILIASGSRCRRCRKQRQVAKQPGFPFAFGATGLSTAPASRDTARAMSQENVEIVKAIIDAYNREDWDAAFKDAAPGCEIDFSRAVGPWRGVFGLDQWLRVVEEFRETWESVRMEPQEFIEAGDLVVVPMAQHVKGRAGIEAVARATFVWTIRNGAIERFSMYQEKEDALEALGLSEQDAHADS
jgi:ketosteroid isomerase-like protein